MIVAMGLQTAMVSGQRAAGKEREVVEGITTTRIIQGEPYELAGKRMVFLNWYYIRPGVDADWRTPSGENARVEGSFGPWEARFRSFDHARGIRLAVQPAKHVGPLLELERPWERKGIAFGTVIRHGDRYRCWGSCDVSKPGQPPDIHPCYFESQDGMNWKRPELGLVEFEGDKKNNLLGLSLGTVFLDPSAPQPERYKSVVASSISREEFDAYRQRRPEPDAWEPRALLMLKEAGTVSCIRGALSPDGLHWTAVSHPLVVEYSDTQIVAYHDRVLGKYVMYTRWWAAGPRTDRLPPDIRHCWTGIGRRCIGRSESADFRNFPVSTKILEPTPRMRPADVLYTNCRTTIPGAPDHHVMFPAIWHTDDDTTTIMMFSSSDGRVWHDLPGGPVLETSTFGKWDGGCIFAGPNLVELPDGSFALPYTGYALPHKYSRGAWKFQPGYAVWPKGRIVALEAEEEGEFATVAFMPPGRKLLLNAVTKRAGEIRIQVEGVAGRGFAECDGICGDQYRKPVTWKGQADLGYPHGAPIVLRFRMKKAKLFSLEFE